MEQLANRYYFSSSDQRWNEQRLNLGHVFDLWFDDVLKQSDFALGSWSSTKMVWNLCLQEPISAPKLSAASSHHIDLSEIVLPY